MQLVKLCSRVTTNYFIIFHKFIFMGNKMHHEFFYTSQAGTKTICNSGKKSVLLGENFLVAVKECTNGQSSCFPSFLTHSTSTHSTTQHQ